jgi:hypothetical protein
LLEPDRLRGAALKIVFCTPTVTRPHSAYLDALEWSLPALEAAGIEHDAVFRVGDVYISHSRAHMLAKAMKTDAEAFVFLDYDISWRPSDLVRLIKHPGDVVAGDYRFKHWPEEYMAKVFTTDDGHPVVREDGTFKAHAVPAGFLKVTRVGVEKFRKAYPELQFGGDEFIDLFNHGAHAGMWWGEDYAFSRRWRDMGEEIYLIPDLNITHHMKDRCFAGNLHEFMLRQPGGSKDAVNAV